MIATSKISILLMKKSICSVEFHDIGTPNTITWHLV